MYTYVCSLVVEHDIFLLDNEPLLMVRYDDESCLMRFDDDDESCLTPCSYNKMVI